MHPNLNLNLDLNFTFKFNLHLTLNARSQFSFIPPGPCRGFQAAAAKLGSELKEFQRSMGGGRSLAKLSPWFDAFSTPAGVTAIQPAAKRILTEVIKNQVRRYTLMIRIHGRCCL